MTAFLLLSAFAANAVDEAQSDSTNTPIYLVSQPEHYLRLVPVSVHGDRYRPILFGDSLTPGDPGVSHFASLHGGEVIVVTGKTIDGIIRKTWPEGSRRITYRGGDVAATVAAALAAAMDCPLDIQIIPVDSSDTVDSDAGAEVEITGSSNTQPIVLRGLSEILAHYNSLVATEDAVMFEADAFAFLAASAAAWHKATLVVSLSEMRVKRPHSLSWVTAPETVTVENVKQLYDSARFTSSSAIYDPMIGILTARNQSELSFLLARTFAYHNLKGDWRDRAVQAGMGVSPLIDHKRYGRLQFTNIKGDSLTTASFTAAIQDASWVFIGAHGSATGMKLTDRSWPGEQPLPPLPPLIFIAESCNTGDINGSDIDRNIALRVIAAGAVAYVGSMEMGGVQSGAEHPFLGSTPDFPLGEHTRLQSSGRVDAIDHWPHSILIGDPLLSQFKESPYICQVTREDDIYRVEVRGPKELTDYSLAMTILDTTEIQSAKIVAGDKEDSRARGFIGPSGLLCAPAFGRQSVIISWPGGDGTIRLSTNKPLSLRALYIIGQGQMGMIILFYDVPTVFEYGPQTIIGITLMTVLVALVTSIAGKTYRRTAMLFVANLLVGLLFGFLVFFFTGKHDTLVLTAISTGLATAALSVLWRALDGGFGRILGAAVTFITPLITISTSACKLDDGGNLGPILALGIATIALAYLITLLIARLFYRRWLVRYERKS